MPKLRQLYNIFGVTGGRVDSEPILQTTALSPAQAVSNGYYRIATGRFGPRPTKAQIQEVINNLGLIARAVSPEPKPLAEPAPLRLRLVSYSTPPKRQDRQLPWGFNILDLGMPR